MNNTFKFIIGWIVVFAIRLIPFRPPNVEPVLATLMPFSKQAGIIGSFLFGFLSIALFDLATGITGVWTIITGASYGLLGIASFAFFRTRTASVKNFLIFSIIGTICYDAATGLTIGPLFFGQSFMEALTGQISFTLLHLLGNIVLSITLSPLLSRWVASNPSLEPRTILSQLGIKTT